MKVRGQTPRPSDTPLYEGDRPRGGRSPPRGRGRCLPFSKGGYRGIFKISPNPSLRKRGMNTPHHYLPPRRGRVKVGGEHPVLRTPLYERGMFQNIEREKQPPRIERDG